VSEATTSELERQLYVTRKELGKANEKIEAMDAENKNLQELNFELLQRLWQTPVSVGGCCVCFTKSNDLIPRQDTFDT
jgi:hypothetical protein